MGTRVTGVAPVVGILLPSSGDKRHKI